MKIIKGAVKEPLKVLIYGPEGIGKSTFASQFPEPLFIDTEGSTIRMDVARMEKPTSWQMLMQQVAYVRDNPDVCKTLVIDTADWAEQLCSNYVISQKQGMKSIEDYGYGKGYVILAEEFARLLHRLDDVRSKGIHIVLTAHAQMRKFEQPDELGAYDRWELKLQKKTAPLIKEWADTVLFANYKTMVVNVDNQGAQKGKNKARGGKRVLYTSHHPCWDAKNRFDLPGEVDMSYDSIRHVVDGTTPIPASVPEPVKEEPAVPTPEVTKEHEEPKEEPKPAPAAPPKEVVKPKVREIPDRLKPLYDLMDADQIPEEYVQEAVGEKGYYPRSTPIANYDQEFVDGVLVGAWDQIKKYIKENIELPF